MSNETDLDWLARTEHHWPKDAVYVSRHENAVEWHYVELSFIGYGHFTRDQWLARRAELQNKPSWADAPEWAEWLGQDEDGVWYWHGEGPNSKGEDVNGCCYWMSRGLSDIARRGELLGDWRDTLERRPVDLSEPAGGVKERGADGAEEINAMAQRLLVALKSEPHSFDTGSLAEMVELADAEIVKRDAKVCGGEGYLNNHWFERGELPPVNSKVMHKSITPKQEWSEVDVIAHAERYGLKVAIFEHGGKVTYSSVEYFQPIRTERELAIDEMVIVSGMRLRDGAREVMGNLYDAGYRKEAK